MQIIVSTDAKGTKPSSAPLTPGETHPVNVILKGILHQVVTGGVVVVKKQKKIC